MRRKAWRPTAGEHVVGYACLLLRRQAAKHRSVGRTDLNERSSRSHCVFTLKIEVPIESASPPLSSQLDIAAA